MFEYAIVMVLVLWVLGELFGKVFLVTALMAILAACWRRIKT